MHAQRYLLTDVLKADFGFEGFLVSDWMAVSQIDRDYNISVVTSINAGMDMVMVPFDYKLFINTLTAAVERGEVSMERIDDAVRRILRVKAWLGMFEAPFGREDLIPEVGSDAHRAVAREAVRKSLVLLKNDDNLLPLANNELVLIAGEAAEDIGMQCGGWSISWQGDHGSITTGTSVLTGIHKTLEDEAELAYDPNGEFAGAERAPIGIVFIGESPYSEGMGDNAEVSVSAEDLALIGRMRQRCAKLVVVLISGRPLILGDALTMADAFVAAWLPGTEGQGIADVLFGDYPFTGKLSYWWPRSRDLVPVSALKASSEPPLFELGYGLTT
jgi:beta-glucosidase